MQLKMKRLRKKRAAKTISGFTPRTSTPMNKQTISDKKPPHATKTYSKKGIVITAFKLALGFYKKYGKGILVYWGKGFGFEYLPQESSHLTALDKAMVEDYDPKTSLVMSISIVDGEALMVTSIEEQDSEKAKFRAIVPEDFDYPEVLVSW